MVTLGKCLTCSRLQLAVMFVLTVYLNTDITVAMQITSTGSQTIQRAQGETVMLGCTYTPAPSDTGDLDIEWLSVHPDMTQKDQLVISYTGGQKLHYGDPSLSKRMDFTGDPALGDASVSISAVKASDTATYQCKVKKAPGVDMRKVTLVVMVPPSVPKCWVEGVEEKGADVSLRCKLSVGSTPLNYVWIRESGGAIPPTATQNSQTGELMIRNHSESYMGNYLCVVSNPVGKEQCKYTLHAYNPPNKAGIIAAAVIGALLLLLLLLLLIWLLICCYHKRRYEKEVAHEIRYEILHSIPSKNYMQQTNCKMCNSYRSVPLFHGLALPNREDAPAPESRPASRNSSFRSVLGFRSPPGAVYSSVTEGQPKRTESDNRSFYTNSSIGMPAPSKQKAPHLPPVLKYDGSNGYPV